MLSKYKSLFNQEIKVMRTNLKLLDDSIGGGIPVGKITEIVGEPNIGKTSIIFDIMEKAKDTDTIIAYIATSTKSLGFLKARGLEQSDNLILCVTNNERYILEFIQSMMNTVDLFIIDSMPEILTENEEGEFDLAVTQSIPRLMQKLSGMFYGEKSSLIVVNHVTFKDNEMVSKWQNIFKQYCTVRIKIHSKNKISILSHKLMPYLIDKEVI